MSVRLGENDEPLGSMDADEPLGSMDADEPLGSMDADESASLRVRSDPLARERHGLRAEEVEDGPDFGKPMRKTIVTISTETSAG